MKIKNSVHTMFRARYLSMCLTRLLWEFSKESFYAGEEVNFNCEQMIIKCCGSLLYVAELSILNIL